MDQPPVGGVPFGRRSPQKRGPYSTPVNIEIDVQGDLAGILEISAQTKNPAEGRGGSQVKMVAVTCPNDTCDWSSAKSLNSSLSIIHCYRL
ncbi:hypothetical protein EB844_14795 [Paracoccus pantotrophus]|nr:hypothetical protein EB844_14795 [Paracoccus pantotrophus]